MTDHARHYAFPHAGANERRRLELFAARLDPLTLRRIKALGLAPGARCPEAGGGRGSIARWLCEYAGPAGRVTATDSQLLLNGAPIAVTAWSDSSIQFTLPADDPAAGVAWANVPKVAPLVVSMTGQMSNSATLKVT
jgi:hypothetical protein